MQSVNVKPPRPSQVLLKIHQRRNDEPQLSYEAGKVEKLRAHLKACSVLLVPAAVIENPV